MNLIEQRALAVEVYGWGWLYQPNSLFTSDAFLR